VTFSAKETQVYGQTDKLLFGIFIQLFFWNTQLFFKQGVPKIKWFIEYPIKIVDVT